MLEVQISDLYTEVESGARNIDKILTNTMLPALSGQYWRLWLVGGKVNRVKVRIGRNGEFIYDTSLYNLYGNKAIHQ